MQPMSYSTDAPDRAAVDAMRGPVLLDFGTDWCGHCRAARPVVDDAMTRNPGVHHLRIEDGPGRRLGRSFGVRLWPTLVFLRDGTEVARVVRPRDAAALDEAFATLRSAG
jgi:thioredoxin 1